MRIDTAEDSKEKQAGGKEICTVAWALGNYFTADDKNLKNDENLKKIVDEGKKRKKEGKRHPERTAKWRERK